MKYRKLIGGKFGFPVRFPEHPTEPSFMTGDPILMANARSCIKLLVDQLEPRQVWLPSYLCVSILSAIDNSQKEIKFYPIDYHLRIESNGFKSEIKPGDLFLAIDYFGFPFDNAVLDQVKRQGGRILRDCSQALFYNFTRDELCDYILFSPRKFLGVPDGGILQNRSVIKLLTTDLIAPDLKQQVLLMEGMLLRRDYDLSGQQRDWFELLAIAEEHFALGNRRISEISTTLLNYGFDYEEVKSQRRKNFLALLENLGDRALFKNLPEDVVPLGFPVVVPDRNLVQIELFKDEIYPSIHWDISGFVPNSFVESHKLSGDILTIPCDQRYDEYDMQFISETFLKVVQ